MAYAVVIFVLLIVLSPHLGLALLSFGTIWSFSVLPDAFTLANYREVFEFVFHEHRKEKSLH